MRLLILLVALGLGVHPSLSQDFDRSRAPAEAAAAADTLRLGDDGGGLGLVCYREGLLARRPGRLSDWLDAPLRSRVEEDDRVRTGEQGRAEIQFKTRNILRLAPATTLHLARLVEEEREAAIAVDLELEEGGLWAELDNLDEDDEFTVRSRVMGAAITGTSFTLDVDASQETVLTVHRGEVRVAADAASLRGAKPAIGVDSLATLLRPPPPPRPGAPVPVPGPVPVAGPREVSLQEWLVIVRDMQEIRIGADGRVRGAGRVSSPGDSEWVRWNLRRNQLRQ